MYDNDTQCLRGSIVGPSNSINNSGCRIGTKTIPSRPTNANHKDHQICKFQDSKWNTEFVCDQVKNKVVSLNDHIDPPKIVLTIEPYNNAHVANT